MAQFLRPNSDITVGGWGTTPLWSKLSEITPDDATTQIQSPKNPTNDTFEVGLSAPAGDPSSRLNHVLRVRMSSGGKTGYTTDITLLQGSTTIQSFPGQSVPTAYGTLVVNVSEAGVQSITNYSQLRVRVSANGGGGGYAYCTWVELQLPDPLIQRSGSAFISGKGTVASTIRKAALALALLSAAGNVSAAGEKTFRADLSGGGAVAVVAQKGARGTAATSGGYSGVAGYVTYSDNFDGSTHTDDLESYDEWERQAAFSGREFTIWGHSTLEGSWKTSRYLKKSIPRVKDFAGLTFDTVTNEGFTCIRDIVFRYVDQNNYSYLRIQGDGHAQFYDVIGGTPSASPPYYHGSRLVWTEFSHKVRAFGTAYEYYINGVLRLSWNGNPSRNVAGYVGLGGTSQYQYQGGFDNLLLETDIPIPTVSGKKDTTGSATVSGGGTFVVLTRENSWSSPIAVSGGGTVAVAGAKNGSASPLQGGCSGGGAAVAQGQKGGQAPATVSGGGTVAISARKNGGVALILSGGGNAYASVREEAYRAITLSGGGTVTVGISRGARRRASISGGGSTIADGVKGGIGSIALSGGGTLSGTGDVDAGTFVWVLIRGGGDVVAVGTKAACAPPVVSGAGRISVRGVRSWPAIALTPPADTDSTALLVLLELDYCGRTFGVAPCLGTGFPCYNTWRTCKYIFAYQNVGRTYRFCSAEFPQVLPDARPYVASVRWMPTEIKTNLTVNARVTVEMADEPDADVGIDPYWAQRASHPGTFWKKMLARNVNYRGRTLKIYEGRPGAPESTYTLRWIGKLDNITVKGAKVSLESVDLLKDLAKIEVPPKVNAKLAADVAVDYTLGLSLTEDADKFPSSGYVRIDDEIIRYESKDDVTKQLSTLSRAQFGTPAAAHAAKTKVQPVRYFAPKSGFDHLLDMLLVDAGIDPGYVDVDAFSYWREWPQADVDFSAVVSEPKKLSDLFFEVVDLLDCKVWVAENLKITIRRNVQNAPGRSYHVLSDEDDITLDSGSVDHNEKSRITRVSVYWDKIATAKDTESTSYRRLDIAVDPDAEENYDGVIEKTVLCRWIDPTCGEEGKIGRFVQNLGLRRITRQRDAQPLVSVQLPPKDAQVLTGDYVRLSTDEVLMPDGSPITRMIFQVVKRERKKEMYALTLQKVAQRRICLIAPSGLPDYGSATEAEKEYGFISGPDGKMSDGTEGYFIW